MENNNQNQNGRKKIAMFCIHSDPLAPLGSQESGGQNIYERYLIEELEKFGWAVDAFTRWDNGHKKQITNITKHSRVIRLKGGPVSYIPRTELINLLPEIFSGFLAFINFENPYELFHSHYWDGGWMGVQASQKFQKPLVHNFHSLGIVRMETKKKYDRDGDEADYFAKRLNIENEIIKNSSVIISLSESEKQNLNKLYGCPLEKVQVIPGGVSLKKWPLIDKQKAREFLGLKPEEFVVLFVGRLEWRKGIGTLISAAKLLQPEIPNLKVIIVGGKIFGRDKNNSDFKEYKRLQKKAEDEKVNDLVAFLGRIDNARLSSCYRAADVFAVPSYYEPFGLVTLEAMANKTPVVASNIDGLATVIKHGENGLHFEPRNSLDLKEKIFSLYQSKDLVAKITENGYQEVKEKYSWYKIVGQISDIYNNLILNNLKSNENNPNSSS
jgi:D-inositol-3-phosphate glycosyltransferase